MIIEAGFKGADQVRLELEVANGTITKAHWTVVGCLSFLKAIQKLKQVIQGPIANIPKAPSGDDHVNMLVREITQKVKGEWTPPCTAADHCHCRQVRLEIVDKAIVHGSHTPADVARKTSAGTGCGSCRPQTQSQIDYRKAS